MSSLSLLPCFLAAEPVTIGIQRYSGSTAELLKQSKTWTGCFEGPTPWLEGPTPWLKILQRGLRLLDQDHAQNFIKKDPSFPLLQECLKRNTMPDMCASFNSAQASEPGPSQTPCKLHPIKGKGAGDLEMKEPSKQALKSTSYGFNDKGICNHTHYAGPKYMGLQ